jgi:wyosine [tRNA(Phe)-imidazoG37] synthetase (radical SAM superfamily)
MIAFGPIPSRRLGKSLGINNIVSHKLCSYSCVYCQIGSTVNKTIIRRKFYEPGKLVNEVETHLLKLDKNHTPDHLTFVANGEPTLDINLGKEICQLRKYGIPIAVITNSSLIQHQHVRDDLMEANWVSVKIDTVDEPTWRKINRPLPWIDFDKMLEGIIAFASEYKGRLNTETMLVENYNHSEEELNQTAHFISRLNPRIAYLSIPTRPPALKKIKPIAEEKLTTAWHLFQKNGVKTELLTGFEGTNTGYTGNASDDILNITAVHPLREDSIARLIKQNKTDPSVITSLIKQGLIKGVTYEGKTYYIRNYHF